MFSIKNTLFDTNIINTILLKKYFHQSTSKLDSLKYFKPVTPGMRHRISTQTDDLLKIQLKALSMPMLKKAGRNHTGKITVRHRGGGHKKRIRIIDFKGNNGAYSESTVLAICYDPLRSARLALCSTKNEHWFWRIAAEGQKPGDKLIGKYVHNKKDFNLGEFVPVKYCPEGIKVFNIETTIHKGSQIARAAGAYALVIKHNSDNTTLLKLNSKQDILVNSECIVAIGKASNVLHNNTILGKAGVSRWKGIKPTVRGEAMNPIDHPHGGKTRGGVRLKTVYGKLAKFIKTRK